MLELYTRLFEARSANFEAKGSRCGIGRDEILGAAAIATKAYGVGNRLVLAEMGDEHSLNEIARLAESMFPTLGGAMVAAVMGRPLPKQLESLVYKHPRYKREARRAAEIKAKANHLERTGKVEQANAKRGEAATVIENTKNRVREEIMRTGKCPQCRGAGIRERKGDTCSVCHGSGVVYSDLAELKSFLSTDDYRRFSDTVERFCIERQEWVNTFMRQIAKEKAA